MIFRRELPLLEAIIEKSAALKKEHKIGSFDISLKTGVPKVFKGHYVLDLETSLEDFK